MTDPLERPVWHALTSRLYESLGFKLHRRVTAKYIRRA
jgi:hypothetical protein